MSSQINCFIGFIDRVREKIYGICQWTSEWEKERKDNI